MSTAEPDVTARFLEFSRWKLLEHFGMHYGQILYITKQLRGEDLGLYRELDKTGRL
jgi:hypothetical protein